MKRILPAVAVGFLLGACSALSPLLSQTPNQNVDIAGTSAAILKIAVAQTLTAQPTTTSVPPSATTEAGLFATPVAAATDTPASSPTTAATEIVLTATFEVVTSTNVAATAIPSGSATATPTLGVLTYGTLPPAVPFSRITLINKSRRQAYISLQVVTAEGGPTIIEYPVRRRVELKAPIGSYLYVAWVGGRKMVGEFHLHKDDDLEIFIYSDKIVVR
jgi:hypothetical protein